ncbi:MAG: hypothetical protein PHR43_06760 [Dehalococcoidales bacterium]|nr:hypothetical protein [Dehalococcoidales bacterium]
MEVHLIINGFMQGAPALVVWMVALVLSSVLMHKGSSRAKRFLLTGSVLMLLSTLLSIPKPAIAEYLGQSSMSNVSAAGFVSAFNLFVALISMAGIICLFYAVWKKFRE